MDGLFALLEQSNSIDTIDSNISSLPIDPTAIAKAALDYHKSITNCKEQEYTKRYAIRKDCEVRLQVAQMRQEEIIECMEQNKADRDQVIKALSDLFTKKEYSSTDIMMIEFYLKHLEETNPLKFVGSL